MKIGRTNGDMRLAVSELSPIQAGQGGCRIPSFNYRPLPPFKLADDSDGIHP